MAGCEADPRYETFQEADERAWLEMSRTPVASGQTAPPLAAYRCPHCEGYHVGPRPVRPRKRPARVESDVA